VLLLDDDSDLREIMSELLLSDGVTCVGVGSLQEMISLGPRALSCQLALLDVNLGPGQPSGLDAYRWLKAQSFSGRIVFWTGHAISFPGVAEAHALGVTVLEKPASVSTLLNLVHENARPAAHG
jgi:FixJ family two-component response regulator